MGAWMHNAPSLGPVLALFYKMTVRAAMLVPCADQPVRAGRRNQMPRAAARLGSPERPTVPHA